jgi:hypothetical protein
VVLGLLVLVEKAGTVLIRLALQIQLLVAEVVVLTQVKQGHQADLAEVALLEQDLVVLLLLDKVTQAELQLHTLLTVTQVPAGVVVLVRLALMDLAELEVTVAQDIQTQ